MQNFEEYLQQANATNLTFQQKKDGVEGLLYATGLGVAAYLTFGPHDLSFWLCVLLYIVYVGVVDTVLKAVFKRADAKRFAKNPFAARVSDQLAALDDFRQKHTLHERLHPAVAAKLEACATHRKSIVEALRSEGWGNRNPGSEMARVAEDAAKAAESAMSQAILAASGGYRPKGLARKVWQSRVEANPTASSQVDRLTVIEAELAELAEALGVRTQRATSIPNVLEALAEIRRAEEELDQAIQQQV